MDAVGGAADLSPQLLARNEDVLKIPPFYIQGRCVTQISVDLFLLGTLNVQSWLSITWQIFIVATYLKSMFKLRSGVQNRPYFENIGPHWSKFGSFVDKHHILI